MKHRHHVIPKHMGGSDDPSNIVELSVNDHAEAHRLLFEQYGHEEDLIAWRGLSGIIDHEEAVRLAQSLGGVVRARDPSNLFYDKDWQAEMRKRSKTPTAVNKMKTSLKETFARTDHQLGEKNSQFGTCWIYHSEYGNKKIGKEELDKFLSLGYSKGRKMKTA